MGHCRALCFRISRKHLFKKTLSVTSGIAITTQKDGGATISATDPTKPVIKILGHGNPAGNAAWIDFLLGPTYAENGQTIKPFVGLGTKLSDNLGVEFYNATAAGATGLYFDYQTTGDIDYLRVEVKANQVFTNKGIIHYLLLPATKGAWQGVNILWSDLVLPDWAEVKLLSPAAKQLKLAQLEQIQWAFQGAAAAKGTIAVDNVVLVGAKPISVLMQRNAAFRSSFFASWKGNNLNVSLPTKVTAAEAMIVSLSGKIIATYHLGQGSSFTLPFDRFANPAGVYLFKINPTNGESGPLMTTVTNIE
jgi:hypothetical protein